MFLTANGQAKMRCAAALHRYESFVLLLAAPPPFRERKHGRARATSPRKRRSFIPLLAVTVVSIAERLGRLARSIFALLCPARCLFPRNAMSASACAMKSLFRWLGCVETAMLGKGGQRGKVEGRSSRESTSLF